MNESEIFEVSSSFGSGTIVDDSAFCDDGHFIVQVVDTITGLVETDYRGVVFDMARVLRTLLNLRAVSASRPRVALSQSWMEALEVRTSAIETRFFSPPKIVSLSLIKLWDTYQRHLECTDLQPWYRGYAPTQRP